MLNMKGIDSIFQKEKGQYYNNKARFYQDMLIFASTLSKDQSFKLWDLARFLLTTNYEYRNRYKKTKDNTASKVEKILKRVKRNVPTLVHLRIVKQTGTQKEERGTELIPTYRYTPFGYFLSQIIQFLRSDKDAEAKLFDLFQQSMFKVHPESPTFTIFASNMIKKMREKGLFTHYVSILRDVIDSNSISDISSFVLLLQNTVSLKFHNPVIAVTFVKAWEETVTELEPEVRKLFLYQQKLIIDVKMGSEALTIAYEKLRIDLRDDPEVVALEGFCNECKRRAVIQMKILQYTRRLANAYTILKGLAITCPKCKAPQRTLQLPNLWE